MGIGFKTEAPELVGAIALCVGEEHPVSVVEGDADVLLLGVKTYSM